MLDQTSYVLISFFALINCNSKFPVSFAAITLYKRATKNTNSATFPIHVLFREMPEEAPYHEKKKKNGPEQIDAAGTLGITHVTTRQTPDCRCMMDADPCKMRERNRSVSRLGRYHAEKMPYILPGCSFSTVRDFTGMFHRLPAVPATRYCR